MFRHCLLILSLLSICGCAPEMGSREWCKAMGNKAKLDWTAEETAFYTKYCLLSR